MQLCSIKNRELEKHLHQYKGRVVLRGDGVKDEDGMLAVFTEQSASSAYMAATKFLDVVARLPGNCGEDSDAIGAYTQMKLADATELLGEGAIPDARISLPRGRHPPSWAGIVDPVCPLLRNLYGHPNAGALWDRGVRKNLRAAGFETINGWEGLYVHKKKQLFLAVYVDDFHMAGRSENMAPMWREL